LVVGFLGVLGVSAVGSTAFSATPRSHRES